MNATTNSSWIFSDGMANLRIKNLDQSEHTQESQDSEDTPVRTLKSVVNTPFKKAMFVVQIISYVLIVGSPFLGGAIGGLLGLKAAKIGGLIFGIFLAGEVLFYGSLAFLGKEVVLLIRDKLKLWFKKRKRKRSNQIN
jgi:hypothetical protein